jgi:hypothetical protein
MSVPDTSGRQKVNKMWFSFPCIYIPGDIARGCAEWFFKEGSRTNDPNLKRLVELRKGDDSFFKAYVEKYYFYKDVINMKPNLVDHIDYLIGGSIANRTWNNRVKLGSMSAYYNDEKDGLKEWLKQEGQGKR